MKFVVVKSGLEIRVLILFFHISLLLHSTSRRSTRTLADRIPAGRLIPQETLQRLH